MYLLSQPKYLSVNSREGLSLMGRKRNLFKHNISDQISLPNLTRLDICKGKVSQNRNGGFPPHDLRVFLAQEPHQTVLVRTSMIHEGIRNGTICA